MNILKNTFSLNTNIRNKNFNTIMNQNQHKKQRVYKEIYYKKLYNYKIFLQMQKLIKYYETVKNNNMYEPSLNNRKYLTIIACHSNSKLKYDNLINNINFLSFECNDIVVINSNNLENNKNIRDFCADKKINYIEIDNEPTYDFGKWVYVLKNTDISKYDFIVFTNDSFIIHNQIHHFYNLISKITVELYGYNDSTENGYHYQSYLFSLSKNAIDKFIHMFDSKKNIIKNQDDVINEYELQMINFFNSNDCFLKIGCEFYHKTLNIFFTNDYFYHFLFKNNLLPFTKIKKITQET